MKDVLIACAVLFPFALFMGSMHLDMQANRRTILRILARRGRCSEEDLEDNAHGELHPASFRITIRLLTERGEIVQEQSETTRQWMYRLTPRGAKAAATLPPEDVRPPS